MGVIASLQAHRETATIVKEVRSIIEDQPECPITGQQLNAATCVVVLDSWGQPWSVYSQAGYQQMLTDGNLHGKWERRGLMVLTSTVRPDLVEPEVCRGRHCTHTGC